MREADFLARELAWDRTLRGWLPEIRRLMTIPGVDVTTAATLMATIGRIDRFASPRQLVGYLGLDPRSRQSGLGAVSTATSPSRAPRPRALRSRARHDALPRPTARVRTTRPQTAQQQNRDRRRRAQIWHA
jgi:Transposase IS116/IS110/IS902 family